LYLLPLVADVGLLCINSGATLLSYIMM